MPACNWKLNMQLIVLICIYLLIISNHGFAETITFMTHSLGEQVSMDSSNQLRGKANAGRRAFNIELVREMMLIMGYDPVFEIVPFKRGLLAVQTKQAQALFNVNRTDSREDTVKWVGPLQSSVTHFYENKENPTGIKRLDDVKQVDAVCVLRGNVHHRFLEKNGFENIYPVSSYGNCIDMLEMKRVSLTPLSNLSSLLDENNRTDEGFLQKTPVLLMKSKGYLAFSKDVSDAEIDKWQEALDSLKQSGQYDELVQKYLVTDSE